MHSTGTAYHLVDFHGHAVVVAVENLVNWFPKKTAAQEELDRAATECLFSYHTVMHNQSFRSMDCTSKLIKTLYDKKFSSARTKTEAIVTDVIAPYTMEQVTRELNAVQFVTVSTDASNHQSTKLLPVLVQYFLPRTGIHVKMLDMHSVPGETSDIVTNAMIDTIETFGLRNKVVGFSADNTNANFGGAHRRGRENIFTKLQTYTGRGDLLGLGCNAHMLHNTVQRAADCLPVDAEQIVCKIYNYFSIYTVRVETLKEFCEFVNLEYRKLLGYSKTRWLALLPAVDRILLMFPALKSYFLSLNQCPTVLQTFFENPLSEAWLYFVQCQAALFNKTTTSIQYQHGTAMEVQKEVKKIKGDIEDRKLQSFVGIETKNLLKRLQNAGDVTTTDVQGFMNKAMAFYDSCIDYLNLWDHSQDVEVFSWVLLTKVVSWEEVEESSNVATKISGQQQLFNGNELFSQVMCVSKYATENVIGQWQGESKNTGDRWVEIFDHFAKQNIDYQEVLKLVQFALALPGTNAPIERVFSIMNDLWTEEKSQMSHETVKSILLVRVNLSVSCTDFYHKIKGNRQLLESVHSSEKYRWRQKQVSATSSAASASATSDSATESGNC